jgi:hypothetical protein
MSFLNNNKPAQPFRQRHSAKNVWFATAPQNERHHHKHYFLECVDHFAFRLWRPLSVSMGLAGLGLVCEMLVLAVPVLV